MLISIIIPTLNEEEEIGRLIRNLHNRAEGQIHQVLIADGGSDDRTREVAIREGADIVDCRRCGRAAQMNEGAMEATGSVLYFLHADTLPPKKYNRMIKNAVADGAGAGCFQLTFDSNNSALRFYSWCTRFKTTLFRFGDQSLFVKRDLFEKVGKFREDLYVMEDQQIVRDLKKLDRFMLIDRPVQTSARKYQKNGVIRLQLIFTIILVLYYAGASQKMLRNIYKSFIYT